MLHLPFAQDILLAHQECCVCRIRQPLYALSFYVVDGNLGLVHAIAFCILNIAPFSRECQRNWLTIGTTKT